MRPLEIVLTSFRNLKHVFRNFGAEIYIFLLACQLFRSRAIAAPLVIRAESSTTWMNPYASTDISS